MNDNHAADLVGGGYNPPVSSQIVVASSLGLALILCIIQHYSFPGPFRQPQPRDRTESIIGLTSGKNAGSSFSQATVGRARIAPGPTWRNSVLSLFRVPERPSSSESSQRMAGSGIPHRAKPGHERRGSDAYNYGQGTYATPLKLLSQQAQNQNRAPNSTRLVPQRPSPPAIPGRTPQFAGIGLRSYQNQPFVARPQQQSHNIHNPSFAPTQYGSAHREISSRMSPRIVPARFGIPRNATIRSTASSQAGSSSNTLSANGSTTLRIQLPRPKVAPPPSVVISALPPSADAALVSTPHSGIGMSINSIIDAYGPTNGPSYQPSGSRQGEGYERSRWD
ncbi:hypothetical protein RSOLAG22IIIB_13766 [Rhizoctonia solani]|uniref:Uncharacterized protein n=1 Tax=Rhizoctonia solani TaxID=456999 RepID=A0A0K6FRI7_9AGAM|nr:hypothetical protein RSOLAG22IIIB_13766 [Rhizoctonia solani]